MGAWGYTSVAALLDAMLRRHPTMGRALAKHAEALASGSMDMQAFCAVVRAEFGNSILLEAILLLRGAPPTALDDVRALLKHCRSCDVGPKCNTDGCLALRGVLATVREHAAECTVVGECSACNAWAKLDASRSAAPAAAATRRAVNPLLATAVDVSRREAAAVPGSPRQAAAVPALMMLARSALGELSTHTSRDNSPTASPADSPRRHRKKLKVVHEVHSACTYRKRPVVRAHTVGVVPAPMVAD